MKFKKMYAGIYILIVNILYILMTMTNEEELLMKLITTIISGFIAVILNGEMIKITKKKKINIICFILNIIVLNALLIYCILLLPKKC